MHAVLLPSSRALVAFAIVSLVTFFSDGCSSRTRLAETLAQADTDYTASRYDQAEIEYKNALQIDALNAQAIARLGLIYHEQGREARAFSFLIKTKELQPENLDARLRLGLTYLAGGSLEKARTEARFVLARHPQDSSAPLLLVEATGLKPDDIAAVRQELLNLPQGAAKTAPVLVALGVLELRENKMKDADATFNRAREVDPNSPEAATAIGMLRWAQGDLPAADAALKQAAEHSPTRSPRRLKYAQFKIQTGDTATAKILLEEISRQTPDYLSAWIWLAEVAAAEKNFAQCDALLARALARDPLQPEAMMLAARVQLAKGENAKAVAALERLIAIFPKSPQIAYQLGMAYAASGDDAKALNRLSQAVTAAPGMSHAVLALAEINVRRRNFGAAVASLNQLVQERPDIPVARAVLAEAQRGLGNLDEAAAIYRKLEEQFPLDPQTPYWRGLVLLQQRRPDEARKSFERALELSPKNLPALGQLLDLDLQEKKFTDARRRVDREIAAQPANSDRQLLLVKVLLAQGDRAGAEAVLKKAAELAPESPTPLLALGRMYASDGQNEKALATFQKLTVQSPQTGAAFSMIGAIHDAQKNYPAARDAYEKALVVDAKDGIALNNLAYLYAERFGQLEKASEMAQRARALAPQEPRTADTLGWILVRKKQYAQALTLLQESAAQLPDEPEVHFHVGIAHYQLGDEASAHTALQRALKLSADFPGADEARQRLQILAIDPNKVSADAKRLLEKRVSVHPDDPVAQLRLADTYQHAGETDRALAAYKAALLANPKSARALMSLAQIYAGKNELAPALDAAKAARVLASNDPAIAHTLGRLAFQAGDHRWAAGLLQDATRQLPDEPAVWFDWAEAAYSVGRVADAAAGARQALALNPTFSRAKQAAQFLELLALAETPARALAGAAQAGQVLKSDPLNVPALMVVASASEQKPDRDAAKRTYEKVLNRYPDFSPAQKNLVLLYAASPADDAKAAALATKARAAFPDDAELTRALGIVAYRQGDFARAANLLMETAGEKGRDGELMYYLGMAQWRLNKRTDGKLSLQRALELGLDAAHAAEAKKSLASLE